MFKPSFTFLAILALIFCSATTVFALDPIIIDSSTHAAPPANGNGGADVNYHPNEILKNQNVTKCPGNLSISNTFNPIQSGTGPDGSPKWNPFDVNQIIGGINFDDLYSNKGLDKAFLHLANHPKTVYGDDTGVHQAFVSFDANQTNGSSNVSERSTPYKVLRCQKGQRLVKAVLSLPDNSNQTSCNEQIAWNCGGKVVAFVAQKDGSGCTPIRLADIANALSSQPSVFYSPDASCYSDPVPSSISLPASVPNPNPVSASVAQKLIDTAVEPIDNCSIARRVEVCDKDAAGNPINCQNKEHQIPLGAIEATNQNTVGMAIPSAQDVKHYDLCNVADASFSPDKPNPLDFIAKVIKFFGTIVDKAQTFTDTTQKNIYIDNRISIDKDQTFLNNLIPASDQKKYQTTDTKGSSTDSKDIDPGNGTARMIFANELLPKNF